MGYVPDEYFGETPTILSQNRAEYISENKWVVGSCVERLDQIGFTPMEVLEAGLATITKGERDKLSTSKRNDGGLLKDELWREVLVSTNRTVGEGDNDQDGYIRGKNTTTITTSEPNNNGDGKGCELQCSDLMDRFRNRLIVSIFDDTVTHILGFGGWYLKPSSSSSPPPSKKEKKNK